MKRVLLILNSKARNGATLGQDAKVELESLGFQVTAPDTSKGNYTEIIDTHKNSVDMVVAGGGDGTLRLCLEGILKTNLPFGILPLGTANNLARNIGIPLELKSACEAIRNGVLKKIDVAYVNDVPFFNVAGVGLSVRINKDLPRDLKKKWGIFAYVILAFKFLKRANPFAAEIVCDDETHRVKTLQVTICNGRHYGAGLVIDKDAEINDSSLDLLSTEVKSWWQGLRAVPTLISGTNHDKPGLRKLSGRHIELRTRRPMDIDTDGDITARTPAVFRVEPARIHIFST